MSELNRDNRLQYVLLAVVGLLMAWLYLPHVMPMVSIWWDDPNYSHGFLVPLICAWLIHDRWEAIEAAPKSADLKGLLPIALAMAMLLVGELGHEFFLRRLSIVPLLWGLAWLVWGWPIAKLCLFPACYLALMVPLPYILYDSVAFPLRLIAAQLAGEMIRLTGIPAFVDGNIIHLPHIVLNVVDACSGIRSLISLFAAGLILAYVMLTSWWARTIVCLLVIPVAVLTNGLRVAATGLLSLPFGEVMVEGSLHDTTGWVVFMVAFGILALISLLLRRFERPKEADDA